LEFGRLSEEILAGKVGCWGEGTDEEEAMEGGGGEGKEGKNVWLLEEEVGDVGGGEGGVEGRGKKG
jgi:hypothetical protein